MIFFLVIFLFILWVEKTKSRKAHICKLDKLTLQMSADSKTAVIVSDVSIKNQVATLIAHIHVHNNPIIKTLYHTINVTFTEAKLFTIRCDINQVTQSININCIIVIMDSIYITKRISDLLVYLYQIQLFTISKELREFFKRDLHNSIEFWGCLSHNK